MMVQPRRFSSPMKPGGSETANAVSTAIWFQSSTSDGSLWKPPPCSATSSSGSSSTPSNAQAGASASDVNKVSVGPSRIVIVVSLVEGPQALAPGDANVG